MAEAKRTAHEVFTIDNPAIEAHGDSYNPHELEQKPRGKLRRLTVMTGLCVSMFDIVLD